LALQEDLHSEPSVIHSLGRVIEAGQRTVVNRIDLARLDLAATVSQFMRGGVMIVLGGVIAAVGWVALSAAAIAFLEQRYLTLPASAALVGVVNAALGVALIALGAQRTTRDSEPAR
jgi:hypothetical protein